jgi:hypothetical protein
MAVNTPRLVLTKIVEAVKRKAMKMVMKNKGIIPKEDGSIK